MKHPELFLALWILMFKWTGVPSLIVGAAIGYFSRYWIACCVVSVAVAAFFMDIASSRMHVPPTGDRYAFWIAMLALPVLVATLCGYIAGQSIRRIRNRRADDSAQA
jgi:hypothetical protein